MDIISEKNYQSGMEEAEAFLRKSRREGSFHPESGGKIYYESCRKRGAKGVVVILHGFSESAEKYREMAYYFFRAGFQVYVPDLRGHGRSERVVQDPSLIHIDDYEQYLTDLSYFAGRIVKKENPGLPLYLYAHSMGGGIGAAFLEREPEVFRKAVLSSPMIRPLTGEIPFGAARIIAGAQVRGGKGRCYVTGQHPFRADETFEDSAAASAERYEYYYQKKCGEKLFQTCGASWSWLREAARLSSYILKRKNCRKIRAEILLFQAQEENFVDKKAQEKFAGRVSSASMRELPGTKHEIYMSGDDVLKEYVERMLEFFGK